MPLRTSWTLNVQCNSHHQAEEVFQHVIQTLGFDPVDPTYHEIRGTNIPGVPVSSRDRPAFEVRFELANSMDDRQVLLSHLLVISERLARRWVVYFDRSGRVLAEANRIRNTGWSATARWQMESV